MRLLSRRQLNNLIVFDNSMENSISKSICNSLAKDDLQIRIMDIVWDNVGFIINTDCIKTISHLKQK
jgi:hypothetical protein